MYRRFPHKITNPVIEVRKGEVDMDVTTARKSMATLRNIEDKQSCSSPKNIQTNKSI